LDMEAFRLEGPVQAFSWLFPATFIPSASRILTPLEIKNPT